MCQNFNSWNDETTWSIKNKITNYKNGENVLYLEINKVVLVHCNIVNNDSRVLYTFIPNKSLGQLLDISNKNVIFSKTFDREFSYIKAWFTDQNSNH